MTRLRKLEIKLKFHVSGWYVLRKLAVNFVALIIYYKLPRSTIVIYYNSIQIQIFIVEHTLQDLHCIN